jgi:ion channel POLLUX/CASTOR
VSDKKNSPSSNARLHQQGKARNRLGRAKGSDTTPSRVNAAVRERAGANDSFGARAKYRFDAALSRGPWVVISWLGLLTLAIIMVSATILTLFRMGGVNGGKKLSLIEAFWQSVLRVLDSGSFAADGTWPTRILTLVVTLAGIFIAGSLIGLIANTVDQRIEALRKGRSSVLEHDHTIILGWSERVSAVVGELTIANESRKNPAIVILALHEKEDMEEALRNAVPDTRGTTIVCRRGDPSDIANLSIVNYAACRSVVVIEGEGGPSATVKTLLALRAVDPELSVAPVVAEVNDRETADSLRSLLGNRLVTVNSDDVVAELTAQACRQRGLSVVFHELLDFDGDEIYFAPHPEVVGRTFAETQLSFDKCTVMGRLRADGVVELNPPASTVIQPGDEIIAVAGDDSEFVHTGFKAAEVLAMPPSLNIVPDQRRIIIVGWSELGPRVLTELDEFLGAHTTVQILVDPDRVNIEDVRAAIDVQHVAIEVDELAGGPESVAEHAARHAFHEVIVLGYRNDLTIEEADARTLLTLLAFARVREQEAVGPVRMVAELLDQRHAPLAQATGADDFIVSDELTSLMLAQLAERHDLSRVFDDLFDSDGCTIELKSAKVYGAESASSFAQIVATLSTVGATALGYRRAATGEVIINPSKGENPRLQSDDQVLVLSSPGPVV